MANAARIISLSTELANQIAAGEVIERPASVVKELLENSIDAGATQIQVDIERAGSHLIRITDNGSGIAPDELALAVQRHTTSKIATSADLNTIRTLGFRGEALASIASVSRFTLSSRTSSAAHGWAVSPTAVEPNPRPQPRQMPAGTTVEVRDLFFSVPARRKFLRAERTEARHIEDVVRRVALANMASGFVLRVDGKSTLNLRPANTEEQIRQRLGRVVGSHFADSACRVNARSAGDADGSSSLTGWVGTAASARAQADRQYFFLNARPVRDSVVRHAVRVAYEGVLHDGHHPTFVLFLRVPSASVDVNVHPTKHEVRFREARQVHDFVVSAIRGAISQSPETQARSEYDGPASMGGPVREPPKPWSPGRAQVRETLAGYRALSGGRRSASTDTSASAPLPTDAERGRVLGVVNECLLMQTPQADLGLVDLRALMARSFRRRFEDVRQTEKPQPLLVPAVGAAGDLSGEDVVALGLDVERLGLALRSTGPGQVALSHVPAPLREADTNRILDAVLRFADTRDTQALLAELSALAGQAATGRSPNEYLSELAECDADPFATPLGRRMSGADMRALIAQGPDKA